MKFDDYLREVGAQGRHQVILVLLMSPMLFSCGGVVLMTVFTMHVPRHSCTDPVDSGSPYNGSSGWRDLTSRDSSLSVSGDNSSVQYRVAACHLEYRRVRHQNNSDSASSVTVWNGLTGGDSYWLAQERLSDNNRSVSARCDSWVYDRSVFTSTIATQLNFVCERKILGSHALMLLMLGQMVGALLCGSAADIVGRKKVTILCYLVTVVGSILTAWVHSILTMGAAYLVTGMALASSYCNGITLVLEQAGSRCRHLVVMFLAAVWCVGILWVGLLAYFIRDWQHLQLAVSVPELLFLIFLWYIPESPRWLSEKGRFSEAQDILERIAKTNGKVLPRKIVLGIESKENSVKPQSITMFLRCPPLLLRLAVILYNWFACSLTYYGLSLGVGNLSGNIYLNYCLSACAELASYGVVTLALERLGRKKIYCSSLLLGASACLLTVVPVLVGGSGSSWAVRVLAMVGKFGVNISFITTWIHTQELFPTSLRAGTMGASSSSARIGGVAASYLATLTVGGNVGNILPQIIFGSVGLVAGLLALSLPETNQTQLPDSLEDAIKMSRREKAPKSESHQNSLLA